MLLGLFAEIRKRNATEHCPTRDLDMRPLYFRGFLGVFLGRLPPKGLQFPLDCCNDPLVPRPEEGAHFPQVKSLQLWA